jgi:methyltransferase family protein
MQSAQQNSRTTATASRQIDLERLRDVPGWFAALDQALFGWCLEWQSSQGISGDLVELGVYKGKSAILLGSYLRDEETLVACDLFGRPASDTDIGPGASQFYRDRLCRQDFETNYSSFFGSLPRIVEGPSSAILTHVESGSSRFVHIDAAHRFSNVLQDIASARTMLCDEGIVVLDDYRTAHTPGVAAAVWESVLHGGLVPLCVSEAKFYGTFGASDHIRQALSQWLAAKKRPHDVHDIDGRPLIRVSSPKK